MRSTLDASMRRSALLDDISGVTLGGWSGNASPSQAFGPVPDVPITPSRFFIAR
jgi:hypothetical protein